MQQKDRRDVCDMPSASITIIVIASVVCGCAFAILGHYEKKPKRKFWLEFLVFLCLGVVLVFQLMLLMQGYYFQSARHLKKLSGAGITVVAFLVYGWKTQENRKVLKEQ